MGFMTMLLTNPFIYSWIEEKIINEGKNLSIRVKKSGIYTPIKPTGKDSVGEPLVERDFPQRHAKRQEPQRECNSNNFKRRGRRVKKSTISIV